MAQHTSGVSRRACGASGARPRSQSKSCSARCAVVGLSSARSSSATWPGSQPSSRAGATSATCVPAGSSASLRRAASTLSGPAAPAGWADRPITLPKYERKSPTSSVDGV